MFRIVAISFCLIVASAAAGIGLSLGHDAMTRNAMAANGAPTDIALQSASIDTRAPALGAAPQTVLPVTVRLDQDVPARSTSPAVPQDAAETAQLLILPAVDQPHGVPVDATRPRIRQEVVTAPIILPEPRRTPLVGTSALTPAPYRAPVASSHVPATRTQTHITYPYPTRVQQSPVPRYMIGVFR